MMQNRKTKDNAELIGIDRALHRAATNAKLQAEQQGTPYVVYRESIAGKVLSNPTQNKK